MEGASIEKKTGFVLVSLLFVLLLDQIIHRRWMIWILFPAAVLLPLEIQVFCELGDNTSVGMLASAAASSRNEAFEFLSQRWWLVPLSAGMGWIWIRTARHLPVVSSRTPRIAIVVFCLIAIGADVARKLHVATDLEDAVSLEQSFVTRSWPMGIPLRAIAYGQMVKKYHELSLSRNQFTFNASLDSSSPSGMVCVIVIGESSRRANWSHYGYQRETTPLLSNRTGIVWLDSIRSTANLTMNSIPQLITRATSDSFDRLARERSYLIAAREAGFHTAWISTQWASGGMTPELYAIAGDADVVIPADRGGVGGDERALPHLRKLLDDSHRQFLVLHQHGSHSDYTQRSVVSRKKFRPEGTIFSSDRSRIVNAYDNSILETDWVLDETMRILEESGRPSILMYVSDHGENLLDDERRLRLHGGTSPSKWELDVPAFFWISPNVAKSLVVKLNNLEHNASRFGTFRNLSSTFLDLAGLRSPCIDSTFSMSQPVFKPGSGNIRLSNEETVGMDSIK